MNDMVGCMSKAYNIVKRISRKKRQTKIKYLDYAIRFVNCLIKNNITTAFPHGSCGPILTSSQHSTSLTEVNGLF